MFRTISARVLSHLTAAGSAGSSRAELVAALHTTPGALRGTLTRMRRAGLVAGATRVYLAAHAPTLAGLLARVARRVAALHRDGPAVRWEERMAGLAALVAEAEALARGGNAVAAQGPVPGQGAAGA